MRARGGRGWNRSPRDSTPRSRFDARLGASRFRHKGRQLHLRVEGGGINYSIMEIVRNLLFSPWGEEVGIPLFNFHARCLRDLFGGEGVNFSRRIDRGGWLVWNYGFPIRPSERVVKFNFEQFSNFSSEIYSTCPSWIMEILNNIEVIRWWSIIWKKEKQRYNNSRLCNWIIEFWNSIFSNLRWSFFFQFARNLARVVERKRDNKWGNVSRKYKYQIFSLYLSIWQD